MVRLARSRGPPPEAALGRPAAARRAGARAGLRAARAAARRAAEQSRRQAAHRDALRDPQPAARARPHCPLRHARPGRGAEHFRPRDGDEPGARSSRSARPGTCTTGRGRCSWPPSSEPRTSCRRARRWQRRARCRDVRSASPAQRVTGPGSLVVRPEGVRFGRRRRRGRRRRHGAGRDAARRDAAGRCRACRRRARARRHSAHGGTEPDLRRDDAVR